MSPKKSWMHIRPFTLTGGLKSYHPLPRRRPADHSGQSPLHSAQRVHYTPAISSSFDSERSHFPMDLFSTPSSDSPGSSLTTMPNSFDTSFNARLPNSRLPLRPGLGGLMNIPQSNTTLSLPCSTSAVRSPTRLKKIRALLLCRSPL